MTPRLDSGAGERGMKWCDEISRLYQQGRKGPSCTGRGYKAHHDGDAAARQKLSGAPARGCASRKRGFVGRELPYHAARCGQPKKNPHATHGPQNRRMNALRSIR